LKVRGDFGYGEVIDEKTILDRSPFQVGLGYTLDDFGFGSRDREVGGKSTKLSAQFIGY
jgi:hypothetical protein